GAITLVRNDIVHMGTQFNAPRRRGKNDPTEFYISNKATALNKSRLREGVISARMLEALTDDVFKIQANLLLFSSRGRQSEEYVRRTFADTLSQPWRYTPQPQSSQGGRRRSKSQKPKRQPRS